MIVDEKFSDFVMAERDKFEQEFIRSVDLIAFQEQERRWVKNNLDFLYGKSTADAILSIHPYCKFLRDESTGNPVTNYIFVPKSLALGHIHIHIGVLDQADKMIQLIAGYKYQFSREELVSVLLNSCTPSKRITLRERIDTLIRKFLSYQYLVIN